MVFYSSIYAQAQHDLLYVYRTALEKAPYIKAEYTKYKAQSMKEDIKLGDMLPSLDVTASPGIMNVSEGEFEGTTVGVIYNARLSQVLFDYNLYKSHKAFKKNSLAYENNFMHLKQQYMLETMKTYFRIVFAEHRMKITKQKLLAQKKLLLISEDKFSKRLIHVGDLEQIRFNYITTKARYTEDQRSLGTEYIELEKLITEPITDILIDFDEKIIQSPYPLDINYWINLGIQNNFNLKFKRNRTQFQQDAIYACQGKFLPRIRLNVNYGYNINPFLIPGTDISYVSENPISQKIKSNYNQLCLEETTVSTIPVGTKGLMNVPLYARYVSASIGIVLTWNILSGGSTYASLKQASDQYVQATYETLQAKRDIKLNIQKNYYATLSYLRIIKLLRSTTESSNKAYEILMSKYRANLSGLSDAVEQMNLSYNSQYKLVDMESKYINAFLDLKLASGTFSVEDVAKLNRYFVHSVK